MIFKDFPEIIGHHSTYHPEKIFCHEISTQRSFTYFQFSQHINQCSNYLSSLGLVTGNKVTLCLNNSYVFLVIYFSTLKINAGINPLPTTLSIEEIRKNIHFLESDFLVLNEKHKGNDFNILNDILFVDTNQQEFFKIIENYSTEFSNRIKDENSIACYYYTSGTTSDPKCIMYSHLNMIALISSMSRSFRFNHDDNHLGFLPLGHTAITNYQMLPVIYNASTLILCDNFTRIRPVFWDLITKYKITYVEAVPTILFMMLNTPYNDDIIANNTTLKYIGCGSAPLSIDIQLQFQRRFKIPIANLYGLSETGPSHFDNPFEDNWEPGSIGIPIDANECKIIKNKKSYAKHGEIGEIALKGNNVFIGYYKNSEAHKRVMLNEYFLTGDLGYQDDNGKFYFADRKKDLIIKGGVNILPGEIEEVLYQIKEIEMAAIIGIKDVVFGEDILAFVKLRHKDAISKEKIYEYLDKKLNYFKLPKELYIIDKIPIGPSGKILKRELISGFKNGLYGTTSK